MAVNDWANSSVAPNTPVNILPAVAGVGELESIYFVSSAPGPTELAWLEQNPDITVDGTDFRYGGTEDFFGNQFYGDQFHGRTDEYGIARYFSSGAPDSGIAMVWQNANTGNLPATLVGSLAVYYTEN
jgi:hypothetical protein